MILTNKRFIAGQISGICAAEAGIWFNDFPILGIFFVCISIGLLIADKRIYKNRRS